MIKKFLSRFFIFWGVLFFGSITALTLLNLKKTMVVPTLKQDVILTWDMSESIREAAPAAQDISSLVTGARGLVLRDFVLALEQASKDPHVKALMIRGEDLSFGLGQLEEIRDAIKRFQESGKLVTFFTDTFGEARSGLGQYYLASIADEIVMEPMGGLYLSGLQAELPLAGAALKKLGVKPRIGKREEYKTAFSFLTDEELSEANAQQTQEMLRSIFSTLLTAIVAGREVPRERLESYMENTPIMTAEQAVANHLVDRLQPFSLYQEGLRKRFASKGSGQPEKPSLVLGDKKKKPGPDFLPLDQYIPYIYKKGSPDSAAAKIAVIHLDGTIMRGNSRGNFFNGEIVAGTKNIQKAFQAAFDDGYVKAIILRIDSPGGSAVATDVIANLIEEAQTVHRIPVIASIVNVGASGGYWIAASCHKVLANRTTLTGSIGVLMGKVIVTELLEKLSVKMGVVSEGPNASLWSMTQDYSDRQWFIIQSSLEDVYQKFMLHVAKGRRMNLENVHAVAKGRVWTGQEALQHGLVDEIGGFFRAIALAKEAAQIPSAQKVPLVVFPKTVSWLEQLRMTILGIGLEGASLRTQWQHVLQLLRIGQPEATLQAPIPQLKL